MEYLTFKRTDKGNWFWQSHFNNGKRDRWAATSASHALESIRSARVNGKMACDANEKTNGGYEFFVITN